MDIKKLKKEKEKEYEKKRQNLEQAQRMVDALKAECINLEGQIEILNKLNKQYGSNN